MSLVIGIDMDGVVADFISKTLEKANSIWGLDLKYEDMTHHRVGRIIAEKLYKNPTPKQVEEVFYSLAPKGTFEELDIIDGAYKAVKELSKSYEILFVTKALEWNYCPGEKHKWLEKHFSDIIYNLIVVDFLETKSFINVDFMVEDDPRTVIALENAVPIVVEQPWNREFLEENSEYFRAKNIKEVPALIHHVQNNLFCF